MDTEANLNVKVSSTVLTFKIMISLKLFLNIGKTNCALICS